ncbi:MAG: hypothetical protein FWD89_01670 [Firmicutes bacterium]|nr:hypothetical protein [Bacillota bacterium]MCL2770999.1 hypothetical protein [Bacillota bacterium]
MKRTWLKITLVCVIIASLLAGLGVGIYYWFFHEPPLVTGGPPANAAVVGNGGMAVMKGEWIFFVNGWEGMYDGNHRDNRFGDVRRSGIYRVKAVGQSYHIEDGVLEFTHGTPNVDEAGSIIGAELVVPIKVGHEFGGFYIFRDLIYYATFGNRVSRQGVEQLNELDLNRVRTNGTKNETIATIKDFGHEESSQWGFYYHNNQVYGLAFNGQELVLTVGGKEERRVSGVSSIHMPRVSEWFPGKTFTASENITYFTTEFGSKLYRYVPGSKRFEELNANFGGGRILGMANNHMIFARNDGQITSIFQYGKHTRLFEATSADTFYIMSAGHIIHQKGVGSVFIRRANDLAVEHHMPNFSVSLSAIAFSDREYIYYFEGGEMGGMAVKRFNVMTIEEEIVFSGSFTVLKDEIFETRTSEVLVNRNSLHFDGTHIYFFRKNSPEDFVRTNFYLSRVRVTADFDSIYNHQMLARKFGDDRRFIEKE